MKIAHRFSISTAALLVGLGTMPALAEVPQSNVSVGTPGAAQTSGVDSVVNGDLNQENNIEQGLKSGELSSDEAARLQAHQARIDNIESRDLKNGQLSVNEETRIDNAENAETNRVTALENNGVTADPTSQASTRMANDVQRNAHQENRLVRGVNNGSLTNAEVGALEKGQARADNVEALAASNGNISRNEQNRIRMVDNFQSDDIRNDRHNGNNISSNTNNSVTTQGTLNGSSVPANVSTTANVNTATTGNVQTGTTPSVTGGTTATVANGTAVHTAPVAHVAPMAHMGAHR